MGCAWGDSNTRSRVVRQTSLSRSLPQNGVTVRVAETGKKSPLWSARF